MVNRVIFERAALVVGGILIGASASYILTKKTLEKKYIEKADEEIASMKKVYDRHFTRLEEKSDFYKVQVEGYGGDVIPKPAGYISDVDVEAEDDDDVDRNRSSITWEVEDLVEEERPWNGPKPSYFPDKPYVISYDMFYEVDESEDEPFDKISITYYSLDDTLADDREAIIPDAEEVVGPEGLRFFGYKSRDPNVVHIRNERLRTDFEVVRDERLYTEVILGIDPDTGEQDPIKYKKAKMNE